MFHYSNGKNIEALQQSKRHADSQALTRSTAKKTTRKGLMHCVRTGPQKQ